MPTINEIITTTVEIKDAAVSQEGFGTPLIAAFHNFWPERVRTFSDASELLLAPFNVPVTHDVYLKASALKRQKPSPTNFKVGKRLGAATQVIVLTPAASPVVGDVYSVLVNGITYTVTAGASPTVSTVAAALATALSGAAGLTAVGTTVVTITATPALSGARNRVEPLTANLGYKDTTADPATSIAVDLAAIRAADGDWYGLFTDANSAAEVLATANWAETQRILYFTSIGDTESWDAAVTTDIDSALRNATYHRTVPIWHHKLSQSAAASWAGRMLPKAPGSANWANKSLIGVDKSTLSDGQRAALKAKNCNYYIDVKSIGFTLDGRAASGRFIDITHGNDWFEVRLQERIVGLMANNDKVAYTAKGLQLIRAQIEAQILEGIGADVIDGEQPWSATVPTLSTINPNDRIARLVPNAKYSYVLQGAVNKVQVNGTVLIAP
jgi:hypothetical protein